MLIQVQGFCFVPKSAILIKRLPQQASGHCSRMNHGRGGVELKIQHEDCPGNPSRPYEQLMKPRYWIHNMSSLLPHVQRVAPYSLFMGRTTTGIIMAQPLNKLHLFQKCKANSNQKPTYSPYKIMKEEWHSFQGWPVQDWCLEHCCNILSPLFCLVKITHSKCWTGSQTLNV